MEKKIQLYVLSIVFIFFVVGVYSNAIGQKDQESLGDNQGLYNASDQVVVLNDTNFKANVYNSKRAWLVEYYNSWCGFCHRFAPIWKSLANSVYDWRDIVVIAAIDCANDDNNPLCREYEIMRYPTLKFFPINSKKDFLGIEIQKDKDEILIMQAIIDQLEKEEQEQRGGPAWPNIVPYRGNDVETLWQGAPANIQYQFLIFEEPKTYLGAEVILDMHGLENIRIRRVTSENELLCVTNKVSKFPSVIVTDKSNTKTFLKVDSITREGIKKSITDFLQSKGLSTEIKEDKFELIQGHAASLQKVTDNKNDKEVEPNKSDDKLYQLDLESALRYSLNNEIPLSGFISGEKFTALKTYLKVLAEYFPVYLPKTQTYLQVLKEVVESKNNMTGKEFREHVKMKEKGLSPVYSSGPRSWVGCKGSSPTFRGYPCGLWTMFHTLTVAASEDNDVNPSILAAMHGYIRNFFGCADCADHFQEMARKRKLFEVRGGDESILWLWRAHNEVNERLAGDDTEDPEHKKIQYPAARHCPDCRLSDGKWNEVEVLKYLKTKYHKFNIDLQGISETLLQRERDTSAISSGVSYRKIGWDFTIFDMSICVLLYVVSAAILTLVCIKFAYKKTHKKKISIQNLFGVA